MKLRRRYIRNIRQNLSFYIASAVLTMAALFLFFLFHIAGNAILDFADEFFEKQKLEDAHFTTYVPIPESDVEEMEEEYGITLEVQSYINIDTDGTTARVFQKTRKVDLYDVTVGEDANEKGEVILSEGYAVNMDISIGDQVRIGEEDYTVTGFFQRPDYLYMLEMRTIHIRISLHFFSPICLRKTLQNWERRTASIWSDITEMTMQISAGLSMRNIICTAIRRRKKTSGL